MLRNPNAVVYVCEKCGVTTKASRRSGSLYSHHLPGTARVCPASGDEVIEPEPGLPRVPPKPHVEPDEPRTPKKRKLTRITRSVSVRTVSGGLPGLGKRR